MDRYECLGRRMIGLRDLLSVISVSAEFLDAYSLHLRRLIRIAGWTQFDLQKCAEAGDPEQLLADRKVALLCIALKPETTYSQKKALYNHVCSQLQEGGAEADKDFEDFANVDFDLARLYQASGKQFLFHCTPADPIQEPCTTLDDLSILPSREHLPLKFSPFTVNFFEQGGRILFDAAAAEFTASLPQESDKICSITMPSVRDSGSAKLFVCPVEGCNKRFRWPADLLPHISAEHQELRCKKIQFFTPKLHSPSLTVKMCPGQTGLYNIGAARYLPAQQAAKQKQYALKARVKSTTNKQAAVKTAPDDAGAPARYSKRQRTAEMPLAGAALLAEQKQQYEATLKAADAEKRLLAAKVEHLEMMQLKDAKLLEAEQGHAEQMRQATAQSNDMLRELILATHKSVENTSIVAESTRQLAAAAGLNAHLQVAPHRLNSMAQASLTARKL